MVKHDTLLICSSSREHRQDLRRVFADAYHLLEAGDTRQLTLLLSQNLACIAAVLLDISQLEPLDVEWIRRKESQELLQKVPTIVLSETDAPAVLSRSFDSGAADVIPIGYDPYAMLRRVETIVDLHLHKQHLETMVAEQSNLLRHTSNTMVDALSSIIEYRSVETGQHILRIRHFTRLLLEEVARCCPEYQLNDKTIAIICSASALHDIGKISIPDSILMKPGKLTEEEQEIMKTHAITGCRIIETLEHMADKEYLRYAHNICHYHHERWDGGGYPEGLQGEAIPICAQVVGLADAYDALTSHRVYKEAFSFSKAMNMIFRGECGMFSPKLLECFKHVAHKFENLARDYADGMASTTEALDTELPMPEVLANEDAIERIRGKYFALVHYINGLLVELDIDRGLFHLIYNPYPELATLQEMDTLEEMEEYLSRMHVLRENRENLNSFLKQEIVRFLDEGLRRVSHRIRIGGQEQQGNEAFEVTLMRINPLDNSRRTLAVLLRKLSQESVTDMEPAAGLSLESTFSCRNDQYFTLLALNRRLTELGGYTAEELRQRFGNRLLEMVHPEDREKVRREFTRQLRTGRHVQLEYRIVYKDGSIHWIYNRSYLITTQEGQEEIHSFLVDIQNLHREDNLLLEKLQRYEMILAQTENVLFEWDMIQDTISFSDTWEKIFGYQPQLEESHWSQRWSDCLYPDDVPLLTDCINELCNGSPYEMTEIRMATARGRYLWCRFRCTAIRDARGTLQKISGIIINIDAEKQAEQALQSRAEQDSLTKLLNKDAARKQAEEYFSRQQDGALLIIDLDDFKQINDLHGHLFGDAVLVKSAQEIKKLFRGQDIVARIGGDEFMVIMRGVADRNLLEQRCQQLVQIFRSTFRSYKISLSCSIGIALSPLHGQTYYELFQRADQALYRAKAKGKNRFAIFNPEDAGYLNQPGRTTTVRNPIDSDAEPGMANDNIVRYAFQELYTSNNIEKSINELLSLVGRKMNVSRVYVFENSDDNRFCSNTYEWCNQGILPQIENLQNISYETDIPGYADNFDEQGIFYCPDVAILPKNIYDIVAPQGIKAMLHCAIREDGIFRGYIGFDDCQQARMWTKEQIELLRFFSESLSMFLLRQRRQQKVQRQAEEMRFILDNQDAWIYVVDPETHQLLYVNSRLQEKFPGLLSGSLCHQMLENRDAPCACCPMAALKDRQNHACLLEGHADQPEILLEATKIRWNDAQAVLISGRRLPERTP